MTEVICIQGVLIWPTGTFIQGRKYTVFENTYITSSNKREEYDISSKLYIDYIDFYKFFMPVIKKQDIVTEVDYYSWLAGDRI